MARVSRKYDHESFDSLMRRFKKAVDKDNVLAIYKEKEFYEKPSIGRKREKAAAKKRWHKKQMEMKKLQYVVDVKP
jgi:small subunit ribosomal protein S21